MCSNASIPGKLAKFSWGSLGELQVQNLLVIVGIASFAYQNVSCTVPRLGHLCRRVYFTHLQPPLGIGLVDFTKGRHVPQNLNGVTLYMAAYTYIGIPEIDFRTWCHLLQATLSAHLVKAQFAQALWSKTGLLERIAGWSYAIRLSSATLRKTVASPLRK